MSLIEKIHKMLFEDTWNKYGSEYMSHPYEQEVQPATLQPRLETDEEAKARLDAKRKKLMSSMAKGAYNGVNLFEGTTAAPTDKLQEGKGALSGIAPNDPGVDITSIMNKTSAIWQKMNEK